MQVIRNHSEQIRKEESRTNYDIGNVAVRLPASINAKPKNLGVRPTGLYLLFFLCMSLFDKLFE